MKNMKLTCANVADDRGLILGTNGYDLSWNLWMIVEFTILLLVISRL